ncbi:MAG: sensor domain-containing diguanylate cyclase [Ruminococcus sp.]|uniref:sensor domain-containing diguanylate cyclase n=1 Tax=Ruminococcus sp. TaxID=41978 RepID=UPI0025EB7EDA|nr:sensor domain-containing diguanylate cyclase [Ruminococcus sp.]MBR5683159.1 sensor domain-containing diguanylate cyclase [Ruminococcus sp.]
MDFEKLLDAYKQKTCIISVERFEDGSYGNIRIVTGNKLYCDAVLEIKGEQFVPDSPYDHFFPKDLNFEDFCYRSAFLGTPLHTYINLNELGIWVNMFLFPLRSDKENIGYCIYSYEATPHADADRMSNLSADTAADVIRTCIKLRGSDNTAQAFYDVIEDIRRICGSDHCCILLTDENERQCVTLCESFREGSGLLPMDTYLDENFIDIAATWKKTIGASTCVIIKDEKDMKWLEQTNPLWHESLTQAGVKSIVLFPLNYNGETLGYMWALNFNVENTVKIKETLELTSFFIASEISNYQLLQRLEILSSIDLLTGVKNRNTMNNFVDSILSGQVKLKHPRAIVFADLNGLKRVNDEGGHVAGDNTLRTAASLINGVFYDCDVYRAGGDEFMVIAAGTAAEELESRVAQLRSQAEKTENVRFAIGTSSFEKNSDILTAMRYADEKMYVDKKNYYQKNPGLKYR